MRNTKLQLSIKAARIYANLTQEEASKKLGISDTTLWMFEKGRKVTEPVKKKMCEVYGLNESDIFFD